MTRRDGERLAEERKLKAELGRQYDLRLKETEMANKKVERLMMTQSSTSRPEKDRLSAVELFSTN